MKLQVRHLLHIPEVLGPAHHGGARSASFDASAAPETLALDPAIRELDDVISVYLRKTVDRFDLTRNYEVSIHQSKTCVQRLLHSLERQRLTIKHTRLTEQYKKKKWMIKPRKLHDKI